MGRKWKAPDGSPIGTHNKIIDHSGRPPATPRKSYREMTADLRDEFGNMRVISEEEAERIKREKNTKFYYL